MISIKVKQSTHAITLSVDFIFGELSAILSCQVHINYYKIYLISLIWTCVWVIFEHHINMLWVELEWKAYRDIIWTDYRWSIKPFIHCPYFCVWFSGHIIGCVFYFLQRKLWNVYLHMCYQRVAICHTVVASSQPPGLTVSH